MKYKQMKSIVIFTLAFFLFSCQLIPTGPIDINEPIDVVIVGSAIEGETTTSDVIRWEYKFLGIYCDIIDFSGCGFWYDEWDYPDSVSILNELGQEGWEIIYVEPSGINSTTYLLKRLK